MQTQKNMSQILLLVQTRWSVFGDLDATISCVVISPEIFAHIIWALENKKGEKKWLKEEYWGGKIYKEV